MNSNIRDVDGPSHSELVFITINISEEVDQDDFTDETKKLLVDFKKKAQNFCFLMEKMMSDKRANVQKHHHDDNDDVVSVPEVQECQDLNVETAASDSNVNNENEVIMKITDTLGCRDIDILKKVVEEKKISEDDYYRRTILISRIGYKCEEDSYYKKCLKTVRNCGLISLFENCENFFVTQRGDIRLTYPTRRECVLMLLQAKRILQSRRDLKVNVEIMCPRSELATKMKLKQLGRVYKQEGKIQSYDVIQQKILGVYTLRLRVFIRGFGSRVYDASKLIREGENDLEIDILNIRQNNEE